MCERVTFASSASVVISIPFSSQAFLKFKTAHPKLAPYIGIAEGLLFVTGSIAASTTGYKIGKHFFPDKAKEENSLVAKVEKLETLKKENEKTTNTISILNTRTNSNQKLLA